ncbi:hypothetical protein CHCC20375_1390 [Bacillus licheniformis]|nr:hypothetical protein CHCC20375_1390 [Bacillus licheniformis]
MYGSFFHIQAMCFYCMMSDFFIAFSISSKTSDQKKYDA